MSYKKCHQNCRKYNERGNYLINNCIECNLGYIKQPEITNNKLREKMSLLLLYINWRLFMY